MEQLKMETVLKINPDQNKITKTDIWSVDRIGRLITGALNTLLLLLGILVSHYFLYLLIFLNLNSIFTTLTDSCPFQKLLIRWGAKEREALFHPNGEPILKN